MENSIKISVIIPTLNEVNYVENLVSAIYNNDLSSKEIFIVDGGSTDGTQDKVRQLHLVNANVHLVENPKKFVSNGFNKAFKLSKGKYISLVGAHASYPKNYFTTCINAIESGECDAAGGFLNQKGKSRIGRAISYAMSSKFGVGNTHFRTSKRRMYVDSVAFAVYDRKVFEKVGLLDEELIRNQDDEFHYRLNAAGFRILMIPQLELTYFVRDNIGRLFSQYYQYGYYKPLVFKKVRSGMKLRHLVPFFFVLYLLGLPLLWYSWIFILPLCLYILLAVFESIKSSANFSEKMLMPFIFLILHTSYGLGFIKGLFKFGI